MKRSEKVVLYKITALLLLSIVVDLIIFYFFGAFLEQTSEIKDSVVISAIGTIYALISAFILNNVWLNFREAENAIGRENEALVALWNSADYFDDLKESNMMKDALVAYINSVMEGELAHDMRMKSVLPGSEFLYIQRVIDSTQLDNHRDEIVFQSLISTYKDLSIARNDRINHLKSTLPKVLQYFYMVASFILWGGFIIEGFSNPFLYLLINFGISIIIVLNYYIINDFNQPLIGFIRVNLDKYSSSKAYIMASPHQ